MRSSATCSSRTSRSTEAKHPDMVPAVQHLHGEPVALGDPSDQDIVRSRLCRTQWPSRKVGRRGWQAVRRKSQDFVNYPTMSYCDVPHRAIKKVSDTGADPSSRTIGIIIQRYFLTPHRRSQTTYQGRLIAQISFFYRPTNGSGRFRQLPRRARFRLISIAKQG